MIATNPSPFATRDHKHQHEAEVTVALTWRACVLPAGRTCDGRAHGGELRVSRCGCGAVRRTEVCGHREQSAGWQRPARTP